MIAQMRTHSLSRRARGVAQRRAAGDGQCEFALDLILDGLKRLRRKR
jgi:hypothetical protein